MCGIAGLIDLADRRPVPAGALDAMAAALVHRGPDEGGFWERPGVGLASRRLSIIGLADGRQPMTSEDGGVAVVFNGEAFDYPELRRALEGRGHRFATHCDTEVVPHLWEEHGEGMFARLLGQFALAVWDQRRQTLVLARDRLGICPLYWSRQGDWLLFASEIKALLASGLVAPCADERGIDRVFTFLALPGSVTCFRGVQALPPGRYLRVCKGEGGEPARVSEHIYWEIDFPDRGREEDGDERRAVDELEARLVRAVRRRLRSDVPVASYLSGGIDSTLVTAMAGRLRGEPVPAFTIQMRAPGLDESPQAARAARRLGRRPTIVRCGAREILAAYPQLIRAAEAPVSDTCCAALLLLARAVHSHGFKVALTGEGSDESLAGYPWYKLHRLLRPLDRVPGLPLARWARHTFFRWAGGPAFSWDDVRRAESAVGGYHAWLDLYNLLGLSKLFFYGPRLRDALADDSPYADLGLNLDRLARWDPLNQSLYLGLRIHLPGLLLSLGGDRVAMHSSLETRYPFLDEGLVEFLARLPPRWKLRGLEDKYLLRRVAERWLPRAMARRPKTMFRAPFDIFGGRRAPAFVEQLLSDESLRRTGYFDAGRVRYWREAIRRLRPGGVRRFVVGVGLSAVAATQLWHHTFLGGGLAEVPADGAFTGPASLAARRGPPAW